MAFTVDFSDIGLTQSATLVDLLHYRSAQEPDKEAFTMLEDGEMQEAVFTFADLERQAMHIAGQLRQIGKPGDRVLLLYPPGLAYVAGFFGCLYAGFVAVPAYPPDPTRLNRTLPRLQAIVADSDASMALTTSPIFSMAQFLFQQAPDLGALEWLVTDGAEVDETAVSAWQRPDVDPTTLAFLQYTSGSTGAPRGVMLTHQNLMHNLNLIAHAFGINEKDKGMIWLPPYHDMGLIGGVLQPVYFGVSCVLMSPLDFLQRPMRWLEAISRHGATVSGGPNFAYDLCVRKVKPEHLVTLDLSQWSIAFNGAEPVRADTIERFAETFAPCGFRKEAFYPCYGLAEATLIVSGGRRSAPIVTMDVQRPALEHGQVVAAAEADERTQTLVGCGNTLPDQEIAIVDPDLLTETSDDQLGEVWVSGPSVASGYWKNEEKTAVTFQGYIAGSPNGPYLRTGDLGFLKEGELFICGRIKDLIIIDGLNHYPQDIEQTVETCHPAVRPGCVAAFSVDVDNREQLVVVAEASLKRAATQGEEVDLDGVRTTIRRVVAKNHDLRAHDIILIKPRSIPKTSSGKIQRYAARAEYLNGTLEVLER